MLIKLGVIFLATLGVIFVVMPFFNRGVFDFQCETSGCSSQMCGARTIVGKETVTTCEWKPEYGCLKDCGIRKGKCNFDAVFEQNCVQCIKECQILTEKMDECVQTCYSLNSTGS